MLANEEELFFAFVVFVFVVLVVAMRHGHVERQHRLRVLEQALRDPRLDAATRQEMIRVLDRPTGLLGPWRAWLVENFTPHRVFTAAAWMTMVIGGLVAMFGRRWDVVPGLIAMSIGFAVLAMPIVIRELDRSGVRR